MTTKQKRSRGGFSKKAVAYIRVSTNEQALGPDAQKHAIEAWAERNDVEVVSWHDDIGVSGGKPLEQCPGLLAAVDALPKHRAGVLVVAKRDRLARDVMKAAMVEALVKRQGAVVSSAAGEGEGDDPASTLMRQMIDAFAEFERAVIRARTKAALHVKKTKNERVGAIPYGYMLDPNAPEEINPRTGQTRRKRLRKCPEEQRVIQFVKEERAAGASYSAIVLALEAYGHKPRSGKKWHATQVQRMLKTEPVEETA